MLWPMKWPTSRGMRQREPVEVDHGHPIAQDVDVFRLEVSVSRHDLSRVQRLQGGEYALGEALHPRRELRADPHQDSPVSVKLHLFVLHRQDGDAGYCGLVQFRQPARRKAHRLERLDRVVYIFVEGSTWSPALKQEFLLGQVGYGLRDSQTAVLSKPLRPESPHEPEDLVPVVTVASLADDQPPDGSSLLPIQAGDDVLQDGARLGGLEHLGLAALYDQAGPGQSRIWQVHQLLGQQTLRCHPIFVHRTARHRRLLASISPPGAAHTPAARLLTCQSPSAPRPIIPHRRRGWRPQSTVTGRRWSTHPARNPLLRVPGL